MKHFNRLPSADFFQWDSDERDGFRGDYGGILKPKNYRDIAKFSKGEEVLCLKVFQGLKSGFWRKKHWTEKIAPEMNQLSEKHGTDLLSGAGLDLRVKKKPGTFGLRG